MHIPFREKLNSRGLAWITGIMIALVVIMIIVCLIPTYHKYQEPAKKIACATALDTAQRQLASSFMLNGFENSTVEDAKDFVAYVMNGWDDLCPDGGSVYIVHNEDGPLEWEVVCGLHNSDTKLCTRLNAYNVREQLEEALLLEQQRGNRYPETLPFTLHGKKHTAYLTDQDLKFRRGTVLTEGYKGIVAFYSIVGHSDFGEKSRMKDGGLWYFAYADELHCANWTYDNDWTGDSYRNIS